MLQKITKWFSPPIFPEDDEKTRIAALLHTMLLTVTLLTLVVLLSSILGGNIPKKSIVTITFLFFALLGLQIPMRKGLVNLTASLFVIFLTVSITGAIAFVGTIRAPGVIYFILASVMTGLLISRRAALVSAVFNSIIVFILLAAEINGLLPPPNLSVTFAQGINFAGGSIWVVVMLNLATKSIDKSLASARNELTERQRAEARMRALVENSPDFILEVNRQGEILFINHMPEIYIGKNVREFIPPEEIARVLEVMEKAFTTGEPQAIEIQTINLERELIWDSVRLGPVKQGNLITSLTVILTDIRMQKQAETAIRESEERYRSAITSAGLVPYVIDYPSKSFTFVGDGIFKLTGYTAQEFTPKILKDSVLEDYLWGSNANLTPDEARQRFLSGEILEWHSDMHVRTRTGKSRWLSNSSIELRDETGKARGAIGIFEDITERKQAEKERESFIVELEMRNAEIERFLYTASHDLKSPIVTIKGFLGMLKKDIEENRRDRAQKDFERISEATEKMGTLLSDLLELSRIGRIANPPTKVDLVKVAHEALEMLDGRIQSRNVTVNISSDLPVVYGDQIRLREVFENLIDNAAKYMGDQSSPLIEIGNRHTENEIVFFVKDNGIGIEPKYHTRVFGLFEKLSATSEGTGIGLALIKRIIEVHGGRIWVESEGLGKGSTFCFTIPDGR